MTNETRTKKMCNIFALCDREATGVIAHPVLGKVDGCERCATKLDYTLFPYEEGHVSR